MAAEDDKLVFLVRDHLKVLFEPLQLGVRKSAGIIAGISVRKFFLRGIPVTADIVHDYDMGLPAVKGIVGRAECRNKVRG